jgi:hypothetical protein
MGRKAKPKIEGTRLSTKLQLIRLTDGREAFHYSETGSLALSHVFLVGGFLPLKLKRIIDRPQSHVRN